MNVLQARGFNSKNNDVSVLLFSSNHQWMQHFFVGVANRRKYSMEVY